MQAGDAGGVELQFLCRGSRKDCGIDISDMYSTPVTPATSFGFLLLPFKNSWFLLNRQDIQNIGLSAVF